MTMKITLVGNSHIAALRRGWDAIRNEFDVDLNFFAANSTLYGQLELDSNKRFGMLDPSKYLPKHVAFLKEQFGGTTRDLSTSSAVVLVGTSIREKDFIRNLARFSVDGLRKIPGLPALSEDAFLEFASGIYAKGELPEHWMNWQTPKVYLLAPPVPREDCPENDDAYDLWAKFGKSPHNNVEFLERYHDVVREYLAERKVDLISPPWSCLASNGLTKSTYGHTARRLDEKISDYRDDYHHMGANYGAEVLRHVLATVKGDHVEENTLLSAVI